jgi:hypothetical protein
MPAGRSSATGVASLEAALKTDLLRFDALLAGKKGEDNHAAT